MVKYINEFNETFYQASKWCKSDMNFARFLIFQHFPKLDRVIYLDWDMIVQEDIFKLEDEYNNKEKLVVADCGKQTIFSNIFKQEYRFEKNYRSLFVQSKTLRRKYQTGFKLLGYFMNDPMNSHRIKGFNAGFYIVSNTHFEENNTIKLLEKLIKIQRKYNCFNFGTQVVMNLMCINDRLFIEKKWNELPSDHISKTCIIHWNGRKKPWNKDNLDENDKLWFEYYFKVYPGKKEKYFKKNNKNLEELTEKENNKKDSKILLNRNILKYLARS